MMRKGIIAKDVFDESVRLFTDDASRNKRWEKYSEWEVRKFGVRKVKVIVIDDPPADKDVRELREIAERIESELRK